jgi:hypothetical protein
VRIVERAGLLNQAHGIWGAMIERFTESAPELDDDRQWE